MQTILKTLACAALVAWLTPAAAAAGQAASGSPAERWSPWLGCWRLAEEILQDAAAPPQGAAPAPRGAQICVTPAEDSGATMTTSIDDQPVLVETVVPDGSRRPLAEADCTGWQQAEWSALGARVFAKAEVTCGAEPTRTVSGMSTMVAGPMWLDIQVIESQGRKSVRVRHYLRAATQPAGLVSGRGVTRTPLGGKLSLAEIMEAGTKVAPEALQAAILELGGSGYDLTAKRLLELDAAGVPASVTDLMVALSFPKRFVVERSSGGYSGGMGPMWDPFASYNPIWPFFGMWPSYGYGYEMGPFGNRFSYLSSMYSPFGFSSLGYYNPYYFGGPGVVAVAPGGSQGTLEPSGDGRVINGEGYTRIRRVQPEPAPRTSFGDGSATNGGARAGSNPADGGVSSSGYSGGSSSGGSGERVAVPRPPGGN